MASRWKTFTPNSTLPAADVNDILNPSTADHLARAVAVGTATIPASGTTSATLVVSLPAGRFTSAPMVFLNVNNQIYNARADNETATSFRIVMWYTTAMGSATVIRWFAVQM